MKKTLLLISALMASTAGMNTAQAQDRGNEELVNVFRWYNPEDTISLRVLLRNDQ